MQVGGLESERPGGLRVVAACLPEGLENQLPLGRLDDLMEVGQQAVLGKVNLQEFFGKVLGADHVIGTEDHRAAKLKPDEVKSENRRERYLRECHPEGKGRSLSRAS